MKTKNFIYQTILIIALIFSSCSNDDDLNQEGPELSTKGDAIVFSYQNQSFRDSLNLQLAFPTQQDTTTSESNRWVYLGFYNESGKNEWFPIPGVRLDKKYKIYNEYEKDSSNPELVKFKIIAEQSKNSESYEKTLNYKKLKVIAIKPETIRHITPADLDFKDFFAVMDYFGLDKE
ncbi:hypothetical protein [Sinomicrobium sp. M5D2P17]